MMAEVPLGLPWPIVTLAGCVWKGLDLLPAKKKTSHMVKLTHKLTTGKCTEGERRWNSQDRKGRSWSNHFPLGSWRGLREIILARVDWLCQENSAFQTPQDRCTQKSTEPVAACMGPAQVQAREIPRAERKKWPWAPIPNPEAVSNLHLLERKT